MSPVEVRADGPRVRLLVPSRYVADLTNRHANRVPLSREALLGMSLQLCASVRARLRVNALLFSEPGPDGPADDFEWRVAAMDRAARGSVVLVQVRQLHDPVQPFPLLPCRTQNVSAPLSEPVC